MSWSPIYFKKEHIDIKDSLLEIWLMYLVKAIDEASDKPAWLMEAQKYWKEIPKWGAVGCLNPDLDTIITDETKKQRIISLSLSALDNIKKDGLVIPKEKLNALDLGGVFEGDIEVKVFTELGEAFIKLLQGEIKNNQNVN